ncbi:MAG: SurA N-terminal domain-containing protein [Polyangiaceae bacterium]|nr:SurA N-terminal domain-containing protein [Polyangiaceae bacterium]MCL4751180.1 SurA N-terminal domain-containing protein [Myxococcales bacterium]
MLSFFRKGGGGQIIIGGIVFAIIVVFIMEFRPGREGGAGISRECAVKLLESCIDRKEYFAAFGLIVPRELPQKKVKEMGLRKVVMDGFVERELLLKEAARLGVGVSEEELDEELSSGRARVSVPYHQLDWLGYSLGISQEMVRLLPVKSAQTSEFDYKIYERVVRNTTNRSPKEFKEMQRREVVAQRVRDLVRSRVRVSETEAYAQWERERSKAVARVVSVQREWFGKWVVDASDGAVDDWALKNQKQVDDAWKQAQASWKAECPLVSEVVASVEEESGDATKTEKRQQVQSALDRIKKGEAFEVVAKSASEGAADIGCLDESYGPGAKELLDAVKTMKAGQVSEVLESKRGFHVLKFHGLLAEKDVEKTGKRATARRMAVPAMATELAKEFADKLIEKAKGGAKLEDAAKELALEYAGRRAPKKPVMMPGVEAPAAPKPAAEPPALEDALRPKVEITAPFSIAGSPIESPMPGEAPAAKLFELKDVDALVDKPVRTTTGFAVLQLKEKTLAKKEDFAKDRLAILRGLRVAKEQDAVVRYIAALRSKVKDKITYDQRLLEDTSADDGSGDG